MEPLSYRAYRAEHPVSESSMEIARAATDKKIRAYELRQARKACHLTQEQLSARMGVGQKRISALENGKLDSLKIDTLRRYVAGLGGTLEIAAKLPGGTVRLV